MSAMRSLVLRLADVYTVDTDQADLIALVAEAKALVGTTCLRCDGDGFAATGGGNCEMCHGGGRVAK